jgi:hypothetical protein
VLAEPVGCHASGLLPGQMQRLMRTDERGPMVGRRGKSVGGLVASGTAGCRIRPFASAGRVRDERSGYPRADEVRLDVPAPISAVLSSQGHLPPR